MFSYFLHFKITLKNLLSNLKKSFSTVYIVIYIINKPLWVINFMYIFLRDRISLCFPGRLQIPRSKWSSSLIFLNTWDCRRMPHCLVTRIFKWWKGPEIKLKIFIKTDKGQLWKKKIKSLLWGGRIWPFLVFQIRLWKHIRQGTVEFIFSHLNVFWEVLSVP